MKQKKLILLLIVLGLALFGGCTTMEEEDSQLPWVEQAPWEGKPPGFPDRF